MVDDSNKSGLKWFIQFDISSVYSLTIFVSSVVDVAFNRTRNLSMPFVCYTFIYNPFEAMNMNFLCNVRATNTHGNIEQE